MNGLLSPRSSSLITLCFCITLAMLWPGSEARATSHQTFVVENVLSSHSGSEITIFSQLELSLSEQLIEAINHGVPISIVVEYAKPKKNWLGSSYSVLTTAVYQLERHSLSNRYLLRSFRGNKLDIFTSIQEALSYLGQSVSLTIQHDPQMTDIAVRSYVDIYRLPGPLRFKAFFSKHWHHDSNWSIWPLKP
ncbi:MAG: DUF4390 domain-containing protein [Arenicella sp.]